MTFNEKELIQIQLALIEKRKQDFNKEIRHINKQIETLRRKKAL